MFLYPAMLLICTRDDWKNLRNNINLTQTRFHQQCRNQRCGIFCKTKLMRFKKNRYKLILLAPILISKAVLPWSRKAPMPVSWLISARLLVQLDIPSYRASKFGRSWVFQALARELADTNVDVQYLLVRWRPKSIQLPSIIWFWTKEQVDSPQQIVPQPFPPLKKATLNSFWIWREKLFINGLFPKVVSGSIKKNIKN